MDSSCIIVILEQYDAPIKQLSIQGMILNVISIVDVGIKFAMCRVLKKLSVKRTTFSVIELQSYYMLIVFCLEFPVRFFVDVFCLVFDRIFVHFLFSISAFTFFVDRFDFRIDQLLFPEDSDVCYGLYYFHIFPSLFHLWLLYLVSEFYFTFSSFHYYQLMNCLHSTNLQYHLKKLIHHYRPFCTVSHIYYCKHLFCNLALK